MTETALVFEQAELVADLSTRVLGVTVKKESIHRAAHVAQHASHFCYLWAIFQEGDGIRSYLGLTILILHLSGVFQKTTVGGD